MTGNYGVLQEGARLFHGPPGNVKAEIQITDGVDPASGEFSGFRYENHAVKPRKPWRELSPQEEALLYTSDPQTCRINNFAVIDLPDDLKELVVSLGIQELQSDEEIAHIKKTKPREFIAFKKLADQVMTGYLDQGEIAHKFGIFINTSGRETVTVRDHTYITGLHIDSWDHYPMAELDKCTNRICINLGKEDRYLLLVNQRLNILYSWIQKKRALDTSRKFWKDPVVANFFHLVKEYPVLKIRIKPLQAYIAPTEVYIHDGCTEGNRSPDICMTYRGNFKLHRN